MAGSLSFTCPYTGTAKVAFMITHGTQHNGVPHAVDAFGVCQDCQRAVLFTMVWMGDPRRINTPWSVSHNIEENWHVVNSYPEPSDEDAPEHTPENVAAAFSDAKKALNSGLWTPAGIMARKSIDVATKELSREVKKGSKLQGRIDQLREDGLITEALKLMGHVVRLDGNDAAHEEDPFTKEEAEQICEFAELFLRLTFTVNGAAAAVAAVKYPKLLAGPNGNAKPA